MEELQDAIEDAQYMNAMTDDTPKPTKEWKKITQEEREAYTASTLAKKPEAFDAESICTGALGLYLFTRYVSSNGDQHLGDFLMELASYRILPRHCRMDTAIAIKSQYLIEASKGNPDPPKLPHLTRLLKTAKDTPPKTVDEWSTLINVVDTPPPNILTIKGSHLENVIKFLDTHRRPHDASGPREDAPRDLFDYLDIIAFEYLKNKHFEAFKASPSWIKYLDFMCLSEQNVTEQDFTLFRVLGRGGFGLVNGCKKSTTGKLYAMKMMNKKRIKMRKSEALCMNERNICVLLDSKFIVCLKYAFQTPSDLYLILDLATGGDLGYHLCRKGRFTEAEAKYYSARILLGIAAMHEQEIVYRDLKPENILMEEDGRVKISDLGLACRVPSGGLTGTCGTRGYWAPEMLRRDASGRKIKYTKAVDWFSFGCVVFEFLYGSSPFRSERAKTWGGHDKKEKEKAMDQATLEMDPEYPSFFDDKVKDLCRKLLDKDGSARLGARGPNEIMAHPWFADLNWEDIIGDRMIPPSKPPKDINMATQSEIGAFADDKQSKKVELTDADQKFYEGWEFVSNRAFQEEIVQFMRYEEIAGPITPQIHSNSCCTIS